MFNEEENPTGNAPHTDSKAKPIKFGIAPIARSCIRVTDAFYRGAVFSGVFVVADSKDPQSRNKDGLETIEVECHWFNWRPKTRWIRITLPTSPEHLSDYDGEVVRNLGL